MRKADWRRMRRSAAAGLVLAAGGACGRPAAAGAGDATSRLDGEWTAEFRLEHPATLTVDPSGVAPVRGRVVLMRNERAAETGGPAWYGVYSADLRPFEVPAPAGIPTVVAGGAGGDSVEITFGPAETGVTGRGRVAGDSVTGEWWAGGTRPAPGSSGRFVLRRG